MSAEKERKLKRERKPKAADPGESQTPHAEGAAQAKDPASKEGADEAAGGDAPKRPRRRRSAETASTSRPPRRPAGDGPVLVRAQAKYVRTAPRKARLVIDHIRGKSVDEARAILTYTSRGASEDVLKLLNSAVANAENNHDLVGDELKVHQAYVDEGPTLRRFRPRALGRATRIRKRTSHMTITLTPKE